MERLNFKNSQDYNGKIDTDLDLILMIDVKENIRFQYILQVQTQLIVQIDLQELVQQL